MLVVAIPFKLVLQLLIDSVIQNIAINNATFVGYSSILGSDRNSFYKGLPLFLCSLSDYVVHSFLLLLFLSILPQLFTFSPC